MGALKAFYLGFHLGFALAPGGFPLLRYQPRIGQPAAGEAQVGVVLPEQQAVLGAGGEQAVGLVHALGDQVVRQHAGVAFRPVHVEGGKAQNAGGGVDPGQQPLGRGLLVAGGAVDLARAVEAGQFLHHQAVVQLPRVDAVVFDGVGRPHDAAALQAGDGLQKGQLHLFRQGRAHALDVVFAAALAFRLQKELVGTAVGKAHHLVLDGGAVAGADALDAAGIERRPVQVGADDGVGALVGVGEPAGYHGPAIALWRGEVAEMQARVPVLALGAVKVDAAAVDAGRGAGLEAGHGKALVPEPVPQFAGGGVAQGAGAGLVFADQNLAVQIGPAAHDDGRRSIHRPVGAAAAADGAVFREDVRHLAQPHVETVLILQLPQHQPLVQGLVDLGSQRADRRPLGAVEHADLDQGPVRHPGHGPAQSVDLPDQHGLGRAADGRIAGGHGHVLRGQGDEQGAAAHAGGGQSGLAARVPAAGHDHVVAAVFKGGGLAVDGVFGRGKGHGLSNENVSESTKNYENHR